MELKEENKMGNITSLGETLKAQLNGDIDKIRKDALTEDIKTHLSIICTNDSTIMDSIKKIDNILSKKKWLI